MSVAGMPVDPWTDARRPATAPSVVETLPPVAVGALAAYVAAVVALLTAVLA